MRDSAQDKQKRSKGADKPDVNRVRVKAALILREASKRAALKSSASFDHTKSATQRNYCMMCLTCFSRADLLENHKKYCNGVNGRPTRIEMPEEGKHVPSFQNCYK